MNPQFKAHNTETYEKALHAYRRRRHLKRFRSATLVTVVLALGAYSFSARPKRILNESLIANAPPTATPPLPAPGDKLHSLTDEELIAKFPPDSCFLAEVNGKKILVFKDPAVEKQFFQ